MKRYGFAFFIFAIALTLVLVACNPTNGIDGKDGVDGKNGQDGHSPVIAIENGYWTVDGVNTQVKATGKDGTTPTIAIDEDGYWVINGQVTNMVARGSNGTDGADGHSPVIAISEGYWTIDGVSTGVVAEGTNGTNGLSAYQVAVKNGYTGSEQQWLQSLRGQDGTNGTDGEDGEDGMSTYELYVQTYGYSGTEQEWLDDVLNGTLGVYAIRTITLDYNGYEDSTPDSLTVVDGRTASLPSPVREGYDFLGWYTGEGVNDGQWTNTLLVCDDMELVARWQQQTVTVRYEDKDGVLLSEQTVAYGEDSIAPTAPSVASYVFSQWDGATTAHKADVTLHPVYVAQRYTVTYDTDGGSEIAAASYLFTEMPAKPINPQKSGWVFDGWVIGDTDEVYAFDAPFAADTILRARWSDTVKIYTAADLVAIGDNLTANYTLANNIDLDGAEWAPLGTFSGVLDGDGHKIVNFKMTVANSNLAFVQTNNGTIRNITFEDVLVNQTSVGSHTAVVVCGNEGTLDNVHVKDAVISYSTSSRTNNDKIGGLVANNRANGNILHCSIEEQLTINHNWTNSDTATEYLYSGVVTATNSGIIEDCQVRENGITRIYILPKNGDSSWNKYQIQCRYYYGSICGYNYNTIENVKCDLDFTSILDTRVNGWATTYCYSYIGGAIGVNEGNASKLLTTGTMTCEAKGNSSGNGDINWGGAIGRVGENSTASIIYSNVSITGNEDNGLGSMGGVIGCTLAPSSATNIWFDGNLTSNRVNNVGGICGYQIGTITNAYITGDVNAYNYNKTGLASGVTTSSGYFGKYIIVKDNFDGNGIGGYEGTANKYYIVTDENKEAIYDEDFLYGENILSSNVWGVCKGLSVYLKAFADHEHDYGDVPEAEDRYCIIPGCGYAVKGVAAE